MTEYPTVTVVMPVRNEASSIAGTLGAILTQDYPADRMEVIVADGMSDDGTRTLLDSLLASHERLRIVDNPGRIVPTGLNAAIRLAQGDIVIRVDGHTVVAPDYVRQCVHELLRSGADNVGGRMRAKGMTPFGEAVALATSSPFGVGGARFHFSDEEAWVDTVYLGAWKRDIFDSNGLFDEEMVRDQDDEFNYRLRERGGRILLSPRIKSVYTVRGNLRSLWRQYFQYAYWKVRVMQKHPRQMQMRQFVPPLFVGSLIASGIMSLHSPLGRIGFVSLLGLYSTANLVASCSVAARNGWRHLVRLPLVFAILHFGYGTGYLRGMVAFAGRWRESKVQAATLGRTDG